MTKINLDDVTEFAQIKDIFNCNTNDTKALQEFLENVVMNTEYTFGNGMMLHDFSNIYVLISKKDFPFEQLTIKPTISIDLSVAKKHFVLGYIWLCRWERQYEGCIPYHFIQCIDSRISGLNIAMHMMTKYEESREEETFLFPFEIASGAKYYWKKYFMETYQIQNKTDLSHMISSFQFQTLDIKWHELMWAFEMDEQNHV